MNESDKAWYLESSDGKITWTAEGLKELRAHFARAGIDIRTVRTREQLDATWHQALPYLQDTLIGIACNGPMTIERQALLAIATGELDEADRLIERLRRRTQLGLRTV